METAGERHRWVHPGIEKFFLDTSCVMEEYDACEGEANDPGNGAVGISSNTC
jgi:hypothetical protein